MGVYVCMCIQLLDHRHLNPNTHRECLSAPAAASPDGSSKRPPVRIVCNTWGLLGRTPAAIRDVGAYNNVRLLLYTSEQAPSEG